MILLEANVREIIKKCALLAGILLIISTALWHEDSLLLKINYELFSYLISGFTSYVSIFILVIVVLGLVFAAGFQILGSMIGDKKKFSKQARPFIEFAISRGFPIIAFIFVFLLLAAITFVVVSALKIRNLSFAGLLLIVYTLIFDNIESRINNFIMRESDETRK